MAPNSLFLFAVLIKLCLGVPILPQKLTTFRSFGCYHCPSHMLCAGQLFRMRCVAPMSLGKKCGSDPTWKCETGLTCKNHVCIKHPVSIGKICTPKEIVCEDGAECAGTPELKVCVKPEGIGGECGGNPFLVCQKGLKCRDGVCEKAKVPLGQSCLASGSVCEDETICAGTKQRKLCVKPQPLGKSCGVDPFWVCATGSHCVKHKCRKPNVQLGGDCKQNGSVCVNGSICAGTEKKKSCVVPQGLGKRCGQNPFMVCRAGLRCSNGKCLSRRVLLGESCSAGGSTCVRGAVCAGTPQKKTCVKPRSVGKRCGSQPYWICRKGLRCSKGVCVKTIPRGGNCKRKRSLCADGTVCARTGKNHLCMLPQSHGHRCGQNLLRVCEKGLQCLGGVCRKRQIRRGGDCKPEGSVCRRGLICAEGYGRKQCVRGQRIGKTCGINPFGVCARGLRCVNQKCYR